MAEIKWIKIATDIFDDEKILLIEAMPDADAIIVIWFKLLVLAGKTNSCGMLTINDTIPYNDEMLATIFRRPIATVRLALEVFEQFGMIEIINDTVYIPKWEIHQNVEGMERIREQNKNRKRRQREREKMKLLGHEDESRDMSREVTQQNKDKDKDKDKNKNINNNKRFTPPTREQVQAYIDEKHYTVDAERFIDYYTANGWKVGRNPMKDWKAAVRTWEKNQYGNNNSTGSTELRSGTSRSNDGSKEKVRPVGFKYPGE